MNKIIIAKDNISGEWRTISLRLKSPTMVVIFLRLKEVSGLIEK